MAATGACKEFDSRDFALAWNFAIEKESFNIDKLAQVLVEKRPSTLYNNLF